MHRKLPSLNALKVFEAAARHQGFTTAAEELHVTQAAVSKQIQELEDWLGTALFLRTGRGVVLTEAGRKLGLTLTPSFDRIAGAVSEATARQGARRLKVSAEPGIASRWLVPRLARFHASHPDIELAIEPNLKLAALQDGEADLGLRYGPGGWDGVEAELLIESWGSPVCAPALIADGLVREPKDIGRYPLLIEYDRQWWLDWLAAAGVQDGETWRGMVFRAHLAIEAAETGHGFAMADCVVAVDALVAGKLARPFDIEVKEDWNYFTVWPKGAKETGPARALREWLASEMQETLQTFNAFKAGTKGNGSGSAAGRAR